MKANTSKETINLTVTCPVCGLTSNVTVNKKDYEAWKAGARIQNALSYLPAAQRELLMTGICNDCWDSMFSKEIAAAVADDEDDYECEKDVECINCTLHDTVSQFVNSVMSSLSNSSEKEATLLIGSDAISIPTDESTVSAILEGIANALDGDRNVTTVVLKTQVQYFVSSSKLASKVLRRFAGSKILEGNIMRGTTRHVVSIPNSVFDKDALLACAREVAEINGITSVSVDIIK